jgi:hypothetical protein
MDPFGLWSSVSIFNFVIGNYPQRRFSHVWLLTGYENKISFKILLYIMATCLKNVEKHGDFLEF